MIKARRPGIALAIAGFAAVVVLGAGCSSNPPCETNIAAVDTARQAAAAAEAKLADAERQKQVLQEQLEAETARKAELAARKAELEAKIAELSK